MWKSMKNCAQKWCRSLCAFLFEATCAFGKMCLYEPCERPPWQNFHGSSTYIRDERRIELNKNIYFCLAMTLGVKLLSNLLNFRAKRRLSLPISGFVSRKSSLTCDDKSEAKREQVILDDKSSKKWCKMLFLSDPGSPSRQWAWWRGFLVILHWLGWNWLWRWDIAKGQTCESYHLHKSFLQVP